MYFIFFFKQKTAYEMRISDWSSDVCSSDLPFAPSPRRRPFTEADWPLLSIPAKPPPPPIDWISTAFAPAPLVTIFAFCVSEMLPTSPPAPPAAPAESVLPPAPMLAPSIEEKPATPTQTPFYHIYVTICRRRGRDRKRTRQKP